MTSRYFHDSFYVRMGFVLIFLIFAGFVPFIKMRYDTGGSMSQLFMVHGIFTLGWFVLFTYQASLVSLGNIKRHMTLGKASVVLAIAIVITGLLMMQDAFDRGSNGGTPFTQDHFILLPFMDVVLFVIFYSLAFINRHKADTHKHYMLLTGIVIMDPAVARVAMTIGFMPLGMVFHFGLLAAVALYDRKTYGSIHTATKVGLFGLVSLYGTIFLVGPTQEWAKFVHWMLG